MGEPKTEYDFPTEREYGTMHPWRPGPHKICRIYGFCLKWHEVEDGMTVKLKTKDPNFKEYVSFTSVKWPEWKLAVCDDDWMSI